MQLGVRADGDVAADRLLEIAEHRALLVAKGAGDVWVHAQDQALTVEVGADLLHLRQNLVADRGARLDDGGTSAVRTRFGQRALEALLHALPRDDDQSE